MYTLHFLISWEDDFLNISQNTSVFNFEPTLGTHHWFGGHCFDISESGTTLFWIRMLANQYCRFGLNLFPIYCKFLIKRIKSREENFVDFKFLLLFFRQIWTKRLFDKNLAYIISYSHDLIQNGWWDKVLG